MTTKENMHFREQRIKNRFKELMGYDLNLENPKTFNEKIQWLKLFYHNPIITKCTDKYLVRDYIKEKIGDKYLIPLLGVWDRPEDIDFDKLPNKFVLKVNWGCGQNIIVKDKTQLNYNDIIEKLRNWLFPFENHYYYNFEWQYKNIIPKIICEKYIEQINNQLYDYKVFCFNGEPKYIQVDIDRFSDHKRCIYDINWNKQEFKTGNGFKFYELEIEKPNNLNLMIDLSKILSKEFVLLRVDFYEVEKQIFIGELTFTHGNGTERFNINEWDTKLGDLLKLPKRKIIEYDTLSREDLINQYCLLEPLSIKYREMQNYITFLNDRHNRLNNEHNKIKNELKLNCNWWTLFGISNNNEYLRITLFGIKITIKINQKTINKLAWWIPIRKWRDNFRNKFIF